MLALAPGCSSNLPGLPDPSLSYEVVAQDTAEYAGKRVRWYGKFLSGKVEKRGTGSSVDAVFVDPSKDLRISLRAFAAEGKSDKDNITLMFDIQDKPLWVIGDVAGTRNVRITVGPPPVEKEVEVPVLRNAQFEQSR